MAAGENFGTKQYRLASRRAVALIADITSRLELLRDVREAAVCLWHQYFATRSFEHSDPFPLVCASVSLACKSLDQPRSVQDIFYSSCCSEYHHQLDHEQAGEKGLAQWRRYINTSSSPQSPVLAAFLAAEYALLYQTNFQLEPVTPGRLASLAMWKYNITLGPFWANELVGMLWNQMTVGRLATFSCKVVAVSCLKLILTLKELQDGKPCLSATTKASWADDHMEDEAERVALKRCTKQVFKIYGISLDNPKLPHAIPPSEASEHAHFDLGSPVSVGLGPSAAVPASPCSMEHPDTYGWEAGAAAAAVGEVSAPIAPSCRCQASPSTNEDSDAAGKHAAVKAPWPAAATVAAGIKDKPCLLDRDLPDSAHCLTHSKQKQQMAPASAAAADAKVGAKRSREEVHAGSPGSAAAASSASSSDTDSESTSDDEGDDIGLARAAEAQRSPEDELWDRFFEEDCRPQQQGPAKRSNTVSPTVSSGLRGSGDPCSHQRPFSASSFGGLQGSSPPAPEGSSAQLYTAPAAAQHHHVDADACGQASASQPEHLTLQHEPSGCGLQPASTADGNPPAACPPGSCPDPARQPSHDLGSKGCRDPGGFVAGRPAASAVQPPLAQTTPSVVTV